MKKKVAVLMGSKSDLGKLEPCLATLKSLDIEHEVRIMSAHRTPEAVSSFVSAAESNGFGVIIAAAGAAAHLAGAVAANTILPVIGIPVEGGAFKGFDALLSTVQMPAGISVATVGVGSGGVINAALLAAQILALADQDLRKKLLADREERKQKVIESDQELNL